MNTYDDGDLVKCSGVFRDEDDALMDPVTVFFAFRFGKNGPVTTYQYTIGPQLVREGVGTYYVNVSTIGKEGEYCYHRFYSTGTGQTAGEDRFYVRRSEVV